jgi:hypothetical protein
MTKKIKSGGLLIALVALFLGMFAAFGPGIYNDSNQYIEMHIHREPLYPLFLLCLRVLFGEVWLTAMGIIQNLLAALSIWLFAEYMAKKFSLRFWEEIIVVFLGIMPHMVTKYFSALHLFITNSVMSEALCIPLFTLFVLECFKILTAGEETADETQSAWLALVLAFLLALTRSQMMLTLLLWGLVVCAKLFVVRVKNRFLTLRLVGAVLLIVVLAFFGRTMAVKSYNLVFNGRFINNTYGTVNTLTNILYAADREDGENIKDEEARAFFYQMYDLTEARQANYKYAGDSWREKVEHIEQWHDTVKYEMIEDVFYQTYDKTVTSDYITQNLMADETAGKIIAGVLPGCFGQWFADYLLIAGYGLIRSIAVVHPVINWIAVLLYLSAIVMTIWRIRRSLREKGRISGSAWLMVLALLAIAANVFAVSLTIMALSRYMIYSFSLFYTAYFILLVEWLRTAAKRI